MVSCYHFVSTVIGTFGRIIIVIIIIIIYHCTKFLLVVIIVISIDACAFGLVASFISFVEVMEIVGKRSLYNCWGIFALPSSFNSTTNVRFCDFREKKISVELQRTKEDREELDQQLKEAIHQKLLLSEQLEDWQVG